MGFGELDYSQVESNKGIEIDVLKRDTNVGRLVCTVSTKRYDEIDVSRKSELQKLNLPDPAECEYLLRTTDLRNCTLHFLQMRKGRMEEEILQEW